MDTGDEGFGFRYLGAGGGCRVSGGGGGGGEGWFLDPTVVVVSPDRVG